MKNQILYESTSEGKISGLAYKCAIYLGIFTLFFLLLNQSASAQNYDYGDAPDPFVSTPGKYPTLDANNGAKHALDGSTYLGSCADSETDGLPAQGADGDDSGTGILTTGTCTSAGDDEDGVTFTSPLTTQTGQAVTVDIVASIAGVLNAWVDFNGDGDWYDSLEKIFSEQNLTAGVNTLSFDIPYGTREIDTYARFRFSSGTGMAAAPTGGAADGEVEDYKVSIEKCNSLVCNGGFEDGLKFWKSTDSQVTTDARTGTNALKSVQTHTASESTTWVGVEQRAGIVGGNEYELSMWIKSTNVAGAHVKVLWISNGVYMSYEYPFAQINGNNANWVELSGTVGAPANATEATLFVLHGVGAGDNVQGSELIVDDIKFENICDILCNGSFEQDYKYWGTQGFSQIETTGAQDGYKAALSQQDLTSGDPTKWAQIEQTTDVTEGDSYTLNFWLKYENAANVHSKVQWRDISGDLLSTSYMFRSLNGTALVWSNKNISFPAPAGAVKAKVMFLHGVNSSAQNVPGSKMWIDNVNFGPTPESISNGDFEDGLLHWEINGQNEGEILTTDPQEGLQSLKVAQTLDGSYNTQWAGASQKIKVTGGNSYDISFWMKKENAVQGHVKIKWRNSSDELIFQRFPIQGISGTDLTWTQMNATVMAPYYAETVEIFIWHGVDGSNQNATGSTLYLDNVSFTQVL